MNNYALKWLKMNNSDADDFSEIIEIAVLIYQGPDLLTWFYFNPNMDK